MSIFMECIATEGCDVMITVPKVQHISACLEDMTHSLLALMTGWMKLTHESHLIKTFSQLIKFSPLASIKGQLLKCWAAGKRDRGVEFNELLPLFPIQSPPPTVFTNERPSEKTDPVHQTIRFSSPNGLPVLPSLPCSQYTGFEACRMQTSFYSCMVFYRLLLCMSFQKLESDRTHTFLRLWGKKVHILTLSSGVEHE